VLGTGDDDDEEMSEDDEEMGEDKRWCWALAMTTTKK
jgi:hypothetical protein